MIPRIRVNYTLWDVLAAGYASLFSNGRTELCARLKDLTKSRHVILLPSARAGLFLLFKVMKKNRVIVPAYTCNAVIEAIRLAGCEPDFVPLAADGFNADIDAVRRKAGSDAIILMTHQFGQQVDVEAYEDIQRTSGATLLEDAAAALGGTTGERAVGSNGSAAVISFNGSKTINIPMNGGCISTSDGQLAAELELAAREVLPAGGIADHVRDGLGAIAYSLLSVGWIYSLFYCLFFSTVGRHTTEQLTEADINSSSYRGRITSWQSHLASRQLRQLPEISDRRRTIFNRYITASMSGRFERRPDALRTGDVPCRFSLCLPQDRARVLRKAAARGIDLGVAFSAIDTPAEFESEHRVAACIINFPLYPQLSDKEAGRVESFLAGLVQDCENY